MTFQELAAELIHQIYNTLPTISDVINLSLTCQRFNSLLRHAQKLSTLFAAADREFGPIEDIKLLVTYNSILPAHSRRDPAMSYALLRQMIAVGLVGKRFEQLYPGIRWQDDFLNRRILSNDEARRVRQAVYRYWLYSEAFHNRFSPRTRRLHPGSIEERSQLLRCWSTGSLVDIEDVRTVLETILMLEICPTDGIVQQRRGRDHVPGFWQHSTGTYPGPGAKVDHASRMFHSIHDGRSSVSPNLPPIQARTTKMDGWGDDITQYYNIQSLLKLNPAQILWLYDHATYKWQVESFIHELGEEWFWNNGQTFSDTWVRVMHARGEDIEDVRGKIFDHSLGVAVDASPTDDRC